MYKIAVIVALAVLLSACTRSHLEIFPPLSNPELASMEFAVADLHEDIDAFISGMKMRHPGFTQYADGQAIAKKVEELKSAIDHPLTRVEFYRHVGQLSHLFNDGHSFLIWPYQEYSAVVESGNQPFPFAVEATAQGLLLKHTYKAENEDLLLPRGAKLLSINERRISDMIEHMQLFMGGETRLLRDSVVVYRFPQSLWSIYGDINEFKIAFSHNGQHIEVMVHREQNWQVVDQTPVESEEDFYFRILDTPNPQQKVGYLHVGTFDVDVDWFADFIDETFASISAQNVSSLIIDIRENGGGNTDSALRLTQYIADKDFRMVSRLKEKLNAENRGFLNYKGEVGEVTEKDWTDWQSPVSDSTRFKGETYLLISPVSYSSAIVFATTLKDHEFATLIGRVTGGFANQTGQGNFFNLPNTELRSYVPTRLLVRPSGDDAVKGVIPHVITKNNQTDLAAGIDVDITTALKMINATEGVKVM